MPTGGAHVVVIPVKTFSDAKARLAPALDPARRAALARSMATSTVRAALPLPTFVVCEDLDVAVWATGLGASVSFKPGHGLNGAVQSSARELAEAGWGRITVAHADIADPRGLGEVGGNADAGVVVLVPDMRNDGTNVLSLPGSALTMEGAFRFRYGPGSFARHVEETERLGLTARVTDGTALSLDVDVPADLTLAGLA